MESRERERFDRHLTVCPSCASHYLAFLEDREFLAGAKAILDRTPHGGGESFSERPGGAVRPESASDPYLESTTPMSAEMGQSRLPSASTAMGRLPDIDGYRIERVLGRGGMGVVYEAVQIELNRRVALKLLPSPEITQHPELAARFQREAAAVAGLHHANIVPIYQFGVSHEGYYFAMEMIDGRTLSAFIKRVAAMPGPIATVESLAALLAEDSAVLGEPIRTPHGSGGPGTAAAAVSPSSATGTKGRAYYRQVARWIADVADALYHAHLKGLVHRDIKPGNLMICRDGRIMVLDFGLVKAAGDPSITSRGDILGTLRYMGPERHVGAKRTEVDARTDVYSLGATLYELLIFQPAFSALDESTLVSDILFRDPAPPRKIVSSVPLDLQTICLKAMEKDPRSRYQTARVMADDLRRYLDDLPIIARPLGPVGRSIKFVRRHRTATTMAAVVLVAAATISVQSALQRQEIKRRIADRLEQGADDFQARRWEDAQAAFDEVLRLDPGNFDALFNQALAKKDGFYEREDARLLAEAERLLDQAARIEPNNVSVMNLRGIILRIQDRLSEALDAHKSVKRIRPDFMDSYVNAAVIYAMERELSLAESELREAARLSKQPRLLPLRHLAAVELQLGRPEEAAQALDAALKASVDHAQDDEGIPLLQAKLLLHLAQSAPPTEVGGQIRAGSASDRTSEAFAQRSGGKRKLDEALYKARAAHDQVFDPDGQAWKPQPRRYLGLIERMLALAYLRNEKWPEAEHYAQRALDYGDRNQSYARLILAVATARQDNPEVARKHYDEALKSWPPWAEEQGNQSWERERPVVSSSQDWEHQDFEARMEGKLLWIDSAEELKQLRAEAEAALGN